MLENHILEFVFGHFPAMYIKLKCGIWNYFSYSNFMSKNSVIYFWASSMGQFFEFKSKVDHLEEQKGWDLLANWNVLFS